MLRFPAQTYLASLVDPLRAMCTPTMSMQLSIWQTIISVEQNKQRRIFLIFQGLEIFMIEIKATLMKILKVCLPYIIDFTICKNTFLIGRSDGRVINCQNFERGEGNQFCQFFNPELLSINLYFHLLILHFTKSKSYTAMSVKKKGA